MKSKVVNCIALFTKNKLCFCNADDYKVCPKRLKDNLTCCESILRITPVDRSESVIEDSTSLLIAKDIDSTLSDTVDNFKSVLQHLDGIKK